MPPPTPSFKAALLAAVRRGASPAVWSKAVELVRAGQVSLVKNTGAEADLRVATDAGLKSALVTLFPEDEDWSCECDSIADACIHAAAGAIYFNRLDSQTAPPPASKLAHIAYRLTRKSTGSGEPPELHFARVIHTGAEELPLTTSLTVASRGAVKFAATSADTLMEVALGTRPSGVLIDQHWQKLWPAFVDCEDVAIDGVKVSVTKEGVSPRLRISDAKTGRGFAVELANDASVIERFAEGLLLTQTAPDGIPQLAMVRPSGLDPVEHRKLKQGMTFGPEDVATLVLHHLPRWRAAVPCDVVTTRLPEPERCPLSVSFEIREEGSGYNVLATLVYGDPPCARVDGDKLTWLGGPLPIQTPRQEESLRAATKDKLGLVIGTRRHITADECSDFFTSLERFTQRPPSERLRYVSAGEARVEGTHTDGRWGFALRMNDGTSMDVQRALNAWRSGRDSLLRDDGQVVKLPHATLQAYGHLLEKLLRGRAEQRLEKPLERFQLAQLVHDLEIPPPPDLRAMLNVLGDNLDDRIAPPADLRATLRDYQKEGVAWLVRLQRAELGALLADDMGLGKTLQTIASFALDSAILVIAPTSVLSVWTQEIAKFRPSLKTRVYHGSRRSLPEPHELAGTVVVTTYGTLRQDQASLAAYEWGCIVLDEAQAIKNPESQVARAAFTLRGKVRIGLSGTPIENRIDELWSLMHFINPGLLPMRDEFVTRVSQGSFPLRETLRPFVLRRTKEQAAPDLPPRLDHVLSCELSSAERDAYEAIQHAQGAKALAALQSPDEPGHGTMAALEALLRLRQAATDWRMLPGFGDEREAGSKLQALKDKLIEVTAAGHRAIVFSQWTTMLDLLEPTLREEQITFSRIDGTTTARQEIVREFQSDDGPSALLMSLKAGGVGITLTAADYVFLLDPWWNPAVEDQATARAHRIGQDKTVFVYRLVAKDTVDEKLIALQSTKRALFDAAIGDESFAQGLTREELRALLS